MSIILGPIIGVAESEARIWIKGTASTQYKIKWSDRFNTANVVDLQTGSDGIGVVILPNLAVGTEYAFDVLSAELSALYSGARFATLPSEQTHEDFSFAFFSCHKPMGTDSMVMWSRLSDLVHNASKVGSPDSLRFLMAIGDQIYADEPLKEYVDWTSMTKLSKYFHQKYNDSWSFETVRNVFSRCPAYMMWDDHEIRDGWGSRPLDKSGANPVYATAQDSFVTHQLAHNPFVASPLTRKYYSFRFGKAGFIVLDLRGERIRSQGQMISHTQWEWLKETLTDYGSECDVIFVACSVPFLHLKWSLRQLVMKLSAKQLEDLWNSNHWMAQGKKFAQLLFDAANSPSFHSRIFLLGGDVHVATAGEIISNSHSPVSVISQFTSSGISNKPSTINKYAKSAKKFGLFADDDSPFLGRMPFVITKRNFGVIRLRTGDDGKYKVAFEVHYDGSDKPWTYEPGETMKPMLIK